LPLKKTEERKYYKKDKKIQKSGNLSNLYVRVLYRVTPNLTKNKPISQKYLINYFKIRPESR
jgi:hypothetical protein